MCWGLPVDLPATPQRAAITVSISVPLLALSTATWLPGPGQGSPGPGQGRWVAAQGTEISWAAAGADRADPGASVHRRQSQVRGRGQLSWSCLAARPRGPASRPCVAVLCRCTYNFIFSVVVQGLVLSGCWPGPLLLAGRDGQLAVRARPRYP